MPFSSIALASEKEKKVPAESASSIKRSASQRLTPIHIPPPSQHPVGAPTSSGSESAVSMDMGPLPVRHVTPAANLRHLRKENPAAPAGRQQSSPSGFAVQVNVKQEPTTPQPQNARVQSSSEPAPSQEPVANKSDSSRDAEPPAITPTRPKFPNFNKRKPGEANNEVFDDADLGATRREDHRMLSPISTSVPLPASNLTASPVTPTRDPRLRRDGSRPTVYNRDADLAQSPMDHTGDGGWSNSNGPMSAVSGDGGWPDHSQPSRGTTSQELGGRIDEQQRPNEPRLPTRPSNDTRWSPPPRRVSGGNRPQLPNKPARASDHYSPPPRPYSPPSSYAPPPRSAPLPRARTPPRALPASGRQQQYDHYAHAGPSSQVYSQARRLTPPGSPPPMSRKRPRSPDPRGPDFPSTQRRWSGQYEQPRVVSRGRTPPLPPTYRSRTPTPERRRPEPRFAAPPPIPPMRPPSPRGRTYAIGGGESYRPAYQSPERSYSPPNERPSYEETYRRPYDAPNPVNERMRPVASPPPPPAPRSAQPHLSFAKASDAEHPPKRPRVNRAKVQQAPVPARAPSPPPPPPQVERPVALLDRMSDYPITASTSGGGQNANRRGTERPPTQPRGGSQGRGRGGASRGGAAPRVSLAARLSGGESLQDRIGD
ncbi:hypothetical protein PLICRDRAFT_50918 [Plicaturopsis crispa FD-325 SS-3]|nr:hypothetical protein PLICRDRAFT_50918 [Plicaturopsis crispa FD-325 SS-3]